MPNPQKTNVWSSSFQ